MAIPAMIVSEQLGNEDDTNYVLNDRLNTSSKIAQVRSTDDNTVCEIGGTLSGTAVALVSITITDENSVEVIFDDAPGDGSFVLTVVG